MRQLMFLAFIAIFLLVYGGVNYYIGLRIWQTLGVFLIPYKRIYWIIFWFIVVSYVLAKLGERSWGGFTGKWLTIVGGYWLAVMYYLFMIFVLLDLFKLLNKWLKIVHQGFQGNIYLNILVLLIVLFLMAFGTYNARNPQITRYDLNIDNKVPEFSNLHLVMVSDIHLGKIVNKERLEDMVKRINELEPDLVLFAGDIVDENINIFLEQEMSQTLKALKPKLGSFAVLGNHEYIGGHAEDIIKHLEESGIRVLRDSYEKIADSFYIVGRDDLASARFGGKARKPLDTIIEDLDKSLPIILLDHQPSSLDEAQGAGVDLQFSGHTHRGQFFPNNLITSRIFEIDWGYLKKDSLQVIVSSGYGTWGPPIRLGNKPELVEVFITFGQK
ncbi:MAG: metallophosphoesterase [Clostridia bacterium]|nr:metallophosphoesterase [Clostridia bacterium]